MTQLDRQTWVPTGAAGAIGNVLRGALLTRIGLLWLVDRVAVGDPGKREDAAVGDLTCAEDLLELDPAERLRPPCPQGGEYAGQAYSLDRMSDEFRASPTSEH
jgi:hypothetical protein